MACNHKFESYLNLQRLDFEPTTLIVGTFNPQWPEGNKANWFYGRTTNNYFWDVLPRLYGESSLINATPHEWKQFCKRHCIAITDFISCLPSADESNDQHQKALKDYSDTGITKNFLNPQFANIVQLLKDHPSIRRVFFTRGASGKTWKEKWQEVHEYATANNIDANTLLTPSGNARFQHGFYNKKNPGNKMPLEDFIFMKWKEKWNIEVGMIPQQ